jgi:hypothetical protein
MLALYMHALRENGMGGGGDARFARCVQDVRKALLVSLPVSEFTVPVLIERTRDIHEEVRLWSRAAGLCHGLSDRHTADSERHTARMDARRPAWSGPAMNGSTGRGSGLLDLENLGT